MKTQQTDKPSIPLAHWCEATNQYELDETPAQAHSPLPWTLGHELGDGFSIVHEVAPNCGILSVIANAQYSGGVNYQPDRYEAKANAEFIVRACNNVERLEDALRSIETHYRLDGVPSSASIIATEALAQWEVEKQ